MEIIEETWKDSRTTKNT